MRWPWERMPWGRGRETDASTPTTAAADPADHGPVTPPAAGSSGASTGVPAAWTRLPALQRSVADATAVAPPAAFRASLTTHQNPSFLGPLGHLVDPDGPAGVVGGLASSVAGPLSYEGVDELRVPERPAPPPAPAVQRRIATLQPESSSPPPEAPGPTAGEDPEPGRATSQPVLGDEPPQDLGTAEPIAADSAPPAPDALVVARSAAPAEPVAPGGTVETLGSGPRVASAGPRLETAHSSASSAASTSTTASTEAPSLAVPVQRTPVPDTTRPAVDVPAGAEGSSIRSTLRPSLAPPPPGDRPTGFAAEDVSQVTNLSAPARSDEPVVARSVASTADPPAPPAAEVVGLVADRAPHPTPSTHAEDTGSPASQSPEVGTLPVPLRGPVPLSVPVPLTGPAGPTVQREFSERGFSAGGPVIPIASSAEGASPVLPEPARAGLDDLGYPPLVARSVQRRLAVDNGPDPTTSAPSAGPTESSAAPLSGFSAAISALQDTTVEPAPTGAASTAVYAGAPPAPELVVARHLSPNQTGQLPASGVALQRLGTPTSGPLPAQQTVQRSLIADRSPVATLPRSAPDAGPVSPAPPPVQRLRYEKPSAPGGPSVQRSTTAVAQPTPFPGHQLGGTEPEVATTPLPLAPASAAWSPVALAPVTGGRAGSPTATTAAGLTPAGSSFPAVQRTISDTHGDPSVARGAGSHLGSAQLPAAVPLPVSGGDSTLLVQRSLDAPSPSLPSTAGAPATSITPPASAEQPAMAVSSRTVGLAEMFAMAAAQAPGAQFSSGQDGAPSGDGLAVQRSTDTDVQRTVLDSTGSEAGTPGNAGTTTTSAAPGGPAAPAAPLSGAELEEMARRLYEPLSARLRAELWQDRERSGLLTDLRP